MPKVYITGSHTTRGYITGSGILNNPPRILLQEQDNHTGSYPTIARTGDPDFTGRFNVFFDDSKSVTFFSSYATAEIKFTGVPYSAQSIMLTGSRPMTAAATAAATAAGVRLHPRRRFKFDYGGQDLFVVADLGDTAATTERVLLENEGKQGRTPNTAAAAFAASVNAAAIGIKATVAGPTVKLRQHTPMTGTLLQGNLIQSQSYLQNIPKGTPPVGGDLPIIVTQFQQIGTENYVYPMILPVPTDHDYLGDSTHVQDRIATPNTTGSLKAPSIMHAGVSDVGIKFTPGEKITAFDETRIPMSNDLEFYASGTLASILPGFGQKLSSLTSFSVDISNNKDVPITFSTGTTPGSVYATRDAALNDGVNPGIAYYNFDDKRWEIIGDLLTGSAVDYINSNTAIATGSYRAVVGGAGAGSYSTFGYEDQKSISGAPFEFAGFPMDSKFDATGSQLISMSDYITAPFLLEKVVLQVSGAWGLNPVWGTDAYGNEVGEGPVDTVTFMLMNQFGTTLEFTGTNQVRQWTGVPTGQSPAASYLTGSEFHCSKSKEIVWFGRAATYAQVSRGGSKTSRFYDVADMIRTRPALEFAADYWVGNSDSTITTNTYVYGSPWGKDPISGVYRGQTAITSSLMLEAPARTIGRTDGDQGAAYSTRVVAGEAESASRVWRSQGSINGGRNLFDISSGRSFIRGVTGATVKQKQAVAATGGSRGGDARDLLIYNATFSTSPYVLMPTDKLILAAARQPIASSFSSAAGGAAGSGVWSYEIAMAKFNIAWLVAGAGKMTFYGTMLRDNKPVDFELNQPLTSDAIHEDVRDDISPYGEGRCLDQFDVDPESSFRGGYLDNIFLGALRKDIHSSSLPPMPAYTTNDPTNISRRVVGSVVDGQAGITGSLERFVRLSSTNEVLYDSTVPNLVDIVTKGSAGQIPDSTPPAPRIGDLGLALKLNEQVFTGASTQNILAIYANPAQAALPPGSGSGTSPVTEDFARWAMSTAFEYIGDERRKGGVEVGLSRSPTVQGIVKDPTGGTDSIDIVRFYTDGYPYASGESVITSIYVGDANTSAVFKNTLSLGGAELILKSMFGTGDLYGQPIDTTKLLPGGHGSNTIVYASGSCIGLRGFKYGLINAVPTAPSAVFRYDTFGQFRDMLEPIPCIREYSQMHRVPGGWRLGDMVLTADSATVQVVYVSRGGHRNVNPEITNCQNISTYATSSVPYFDNWAPTTDRKTVITTHSERATIQQDLLGGLSSEQGLSDIPE